MSIIQTGAPGRQPRSVQANATLNLVRVGAGLLFPLLTFPYLSRILGPDGTGLLSFAGSFAAYFVLLAGVGVPLYGVREVAKVRDDPAALAALSRELLALNAIATAVATAAFAASVLIGRATRPEAAIFLIAGAAIPLSVASMEWLYQGLEEYAYITARSVLFGAASVAATFFLVHRRSDIQAAAWIGAASLAGSSLLNAWNARRFLLPAPAVRPNLGRHLRPLAAVFALNFVTSIYVNLDTVMLGFLSSPRNVGYYASAMKLVKILLALVTSLGAVLLPRLTHCLAQGRREEFDHLLRRSLEVVLLLCLPAVAGMVLLRTEIVEVVAGPLYLPAADCMLVTAPVVLFIGLTNIMGIQVLYPLGREKEVVLSVGIGAVVSACLNLLLIPRFTHMGAAWATFCAECAVLVAQLVLVRRHHRIPWPWRSLARQVAATAAMCAVVVALRSASAPLPTPARLVLEVCGGAATYGAVLLALGDGLLSSQLAKALRRSGTA